MPTALKRLLCPAVFTFIALLAGGTSLAAVDLGKQLTFDIPPQSLTSALLEFGRQANVQIMSSAREISARTSRGVNGKYSLSSALDKLLKDTGLHYRAAGDGTIMITSQSSAGETPVSMRMVEAGDASRVLALPVAADEVKEAKAPVAGGEEQSTGVPEILVKGQRSLNVDIRRTEDAPQPYVVFEREEILRSQAVNLEEFLKTRLPMNTSSSSIGQLTGISSTNSSINLRGLGTNQTLILVDGRRMPGVALQGSPQQPDLNGIALSAIERIEILPSTAGGIYGGSATGGVINVVLRRDFQGLEASAIYGNTFDTDAASIRMEANAGFSLEGGRTRVMLAAAHSDANNLTIGDRDFSARAVALLLANDPAAIYGLTSPPLGATANIRSVSGNLVLDPVYGSRPLNSNITYVPLGYAGPASDGGTALLARAGRYNLDMPTGVLGSERGLVAAPSMDSLSLNVRREFGSRVEAFVDFSRFSNQGSSLSAVIQNLVLNLPASAPNNPFQQAIQVRFPVPGMAFASVSETLTLRGTGGLIFRLPGMWTGEIDYGWSRTRSSASSTGSVIDTAGNTSLGNGLPAPDGRPALNVLQEANTFPFNFTPYLLPTPNVLGGPYRSALRNGTVRASGPVFRLPGGPVILSGLIERREETVEDGFFEGINSTTRAATFTFYPERSQDADSVSLEIRAPLISSRNALSFARALELQASVRRDEYRTRSVTTPSITVASRDGPFPALTHMAGELRSTDYTLGLRYAPVEDLALRMSFGTGFLPPAISSVIRTEQLTAVSAGIDARRGNTNMYVGVPYTTVLGGGPQLRPELSESWSGGIILTPRFAPGLRLSIDYTQIEKVDEMRSVAFALLVADENAFPGRIVRGPNLPSDPVGWAGPITYLDNSLMNIASTRLQAYDVQADFVHRTERSGEFRWYAVATWQPHYRNRLLPGTPELDSVGFSTGPLAWRGNIGFDWNKGPVKVSWNTQYYDSYFVYAHTASAFTITSTVLGQGSATIPSQRYHDLIATYRFERGDMEVSLGIQNLFDTSPPILASSSPTLAGYSTYGDPRLRRYSLSVRKGFQMGSR